MPLTILAILSLFFIPAFQYCHELDMKAIDDKNSDTEH